MINLAYAGLVEKIIRGGSFLRTRNSNTWRIIAHQETFTKSPLVSVRKTAWKNALREWEWFMSGSNDINTLHPAVRSWWEPWADKDGRVKYNYSRQFRAFYGEGSHDQIEHLIDGIKHHPFSRRNIVTTWHAADMAAPDCPITNCHNSLTQVFVEPDDSLHLVTYQRSVDTVCGLPHNWIQEWAFLMWLARRSGKTVGSMTWIGGDVHVYETHKDLAERIVARASHPDAPELVYTPSSDEFRADDFSLSGTYEPLITERAEMVI